MSIMLHITYNYALQTIQALSCQGYTHSMSPPTMACSAARLFSISVSRGYCPGSTINTFNREEAIKSQLMPPTIPSAAVLHSYDASQTAEADRFSIAS